MLTIHEQIVKIKTELKVYNNVYTSDCLKLHGMEHEKSKYRTYCRYLTREEIKLGTFIEKTLRQQFDSFNEPVDDLTKKVDGAIVLLQEIRDVIYRIREIGVSK